MNFERIFAGWKCFEGDFKYFSLLSTIFQQVSTQIFLKSSDYLKDKLINFL